MKHARVLIHGHAQDVTIDGEFVVTAGGHRYRHDDVTWLPPVQTGTILALALNYADHATELQLDKPEQPALFAKLPNTLVGHLGTVIRPAGVQYMHYENELAVIIGKPARRVSVEDAMDHVKGYTIFNDLVVRDFVINHFRPPIKPKNFDTFGPIGPWWVDAADIADPHNLNITTYVNGELRQEGNTRDMVFNIPEIISYVSQFMTLRENDVICTGTPKGISHIHPGDVMELHIEGIGMLRNRVIAEEELLEGAMTAEVAR
ncbi:fumarylacetoacetate hydrolase family protein [Deinococcus maricopensis]|uniref:4-hydroxyphenylacetate degradation bifunctional isomerase/decarboxylase,HpaG2 subunit n=1 Tax=Deinococcus maricopensis (strain DSM 21211 / LMG 22137 / NRRL B-23946 / LB-34) TaxID=709986 RepID=E8U8Y8_DEIML|nr:fumarylacetoacetate hydrolase family protein [Deinococcus maricopensis]ADV67527.1 4-hydroxyphenylacetate degradation bifunctional isomerase/decarboxylase,HpaG2 subunit [Deinococcus maricopensis DSM 21211]